MKILVPVKDYRLQYEGPGSGGRVGCRSYELKMTMNLFDELAVEEAIRLKEKGGGEEG